MSPFSIDTTTTTKQEKSVLVRMPEFVGRRIVLAGFDSEPALRFKELFEAVGAFCRTVPTAAFEVEARACDVIFVWLRTADNPPRTAGSTTTPVIAVLSTAAVRHRVSWIKTTAVDCMFYPCTPKEILTRTAIALDRKPGHRVEFPEVPFRILLADDDPEITDLLKVTLEKRDMTCRSTASSLDVLKIAREWNPDVVVLDINMPEMDGYQVLAALKASNPDTPPRVLLLTACDQEAEVMKGFKLGAQDYIVKPFNPADLLMRVRRIARKPV